jgi:hypothetical protein
MNVQQFICQMPSTHLIARHAAALRFGSSDAEEGTANFPPSQLVIAAMVLQLIDVHV